MRARSVRPSGHRGRGHVAPTADAAAAQQAVLVLRYYEDLSERETACPAVFGRRREVVDRARHVGAPRRDQR